MRFEFTDEDIDFIEKNYESMTDKEIGAKLGCNYKCIKNKRNSLGLVKYEFTYSDEIKEFAITKIRESKSVKEVKELMLHKFNRNVSIQSIYKWADAADIKAKTKIQLGNNVTFDDLINHNIQILRFKKQIKIGDTITYKVNATQYDKSKVVGVYKNYITVLQGNWKETVMYTDIVSIQS